MIFLRGKKCGLNTIKHLGVKATLGNWDYKGRTSLRKVLQLSAQNLKYSHLLCSDKKSGKCQDIIFKAHLQSHFSNKHPGAPPCSTACSTASPGLRPIGPLRSPTPPKVMWCYPCWQARDGTHRCGCHLWLVEIPGFLWLTREGRLVSRPWGEKVFLM